MALTSEELNFLIYRYLLESGFSHSAFSFAHESFVTKATIDGSKVPPGALISFVQKGLQYVEIEAHLNEDGSETLCDEGFSVITPHKCLVKTKRKIFNPYEPTDVDYGALELEDDHTTILKGHKDLVCACAWNPTTSTLASGSGDGSARLWDFTGKAKSENGDDDKDAMDERKDESKDDDQKDKPISGTRIADNAVILRHDMPPSPKKGKKKKTKGKKDVDADDEETPTTGTSNSVVCLDWNSRGTTLASGCFDGRVRLWNGGRCTTTLTSHTGPLSALKWNKKNDMLLTAGVDGRVTLVDGSTGKSKQQWSLHTAPVLDVDWRNDTSFASCSMDRQVLVCTVGSDKPTKTYLGHEKEVNTVRWSPGGRVLASGSDDTTVKLWTSASDTPMDLREHTREVSVVRWSNTGMASDNTSLPLVLASASLDTTVKLWEPEGGKCLATLTRHNHPVTNIAFNPSGELLASGSHDRVHIWTVRDGRMVRTYKSRSGITDISWHHNGYQLAVSYSDNTVVVMDLRS